MKRKRIKAVLERCASGFLALMMLFSSINATVLAEIPDAGSTPEATAETLQDRTTETPEENKPAEVEKEEEKSIPATPEEPPTEVSLEPEKEPEEEVPVPRMNLRRKQRKPRKKRTQKKKTQKKRKPRRRKRKPRKHCRLLKFGTIKSDSVYFSFSACIDWICAQKYEETTIVDCQKLEKMSISDKNKSEITQVNHKG